MSEKERLHVQVESDAKERWDSYAKENSNVSNLSQLVRQAMEKEVRGAHDTGGESSSLETDVSARFAEVIEKLNELNERMDEIAERQERLEQYAEYQLDRRSFSNRVQKFVPPAKPQSEPWKRARENTDKDIVWSGRLEPITERVRDDAPELRDIQLQDVRGELERLVNNEDSPIERTEVDGTTRYYVHNEYRQ
ncbi:hypothetical protein [Halorussus salinisoli]|uniref:hypothetical protein n=1 Tax=Halorussus salinisoli TaxID=2558242 RepID=UPI0010C1C997|nr:hypothetical protein [Halorussus salinisoli]